MKHNLKLALRSLSRNKLYTFLSISGFALGFAVCLIIGLYIYGERRMDTWMPNSDRLVRLYDPLKNNCGFAHEIDDPLRHKVPEVENACAIQYADGKYDISVKTATHFTKSKGIINTTADFFKIFPLKVIKSNPGELLEETSSVVITESLARALFPNEDPLGKSISMWNFNDLKISAVVEDFPKNSSLQADIFTSSANEKVRMDQSCNNGKCFNPYSFYVLLKENANKASFIDNLNRAIPRNEYFIGALTSQKIADIYLSPSIDGNRHDLGSPNLLYILGSFGILILLLSTFNFLNFYISTNLAKLREIGIKKINGASFKSLLRYSFTEVSVSILISLTLAIVLFILLLPVAGQVLNQSLDTGWLRTPGFLSLFILITILLIILNSLAPVYLTSRFHFGNMLTGTSNNRIKLKGRKAMTLAQFTVSIALIILTLSIFRQINYVKHADLGFDREHLVRLNFSWAFNNYSALRDQMRQDPGIKSFTLSSGVPGNIHHMMGLAAGDTTVMFNALYADADFFRTLDINIAQGRNFTKDDSPTVCIMNEEAYRQMGWNRREGNRFDQGREGGYEVIGFSNDFFVNSLYEKLSPVVVMLKDETEPYNNLRYASIVLRPGNVGEQMKRLEAIWKKFVPDEPMNYTFYDDAFNAMYQKEERLAKSVGIAASIALILTFMGILGQAFQISINRSKEIGIRKVNGATVSQILAYLNKGFIPMILIAFVIASPIAYFLTNKWLESFAYKAGIGWWLFAAAGIIVMFVVLVTVTLQSYRAATRNPVEALRYE